MFVILAAAVAIAAQTPPYEEAVRCAGLTQAASELEGSESARGRSLFDASLYWSLTASQLAASTGRAAQADADQTRARLRAVRELAANDASAKAALDTCLTRTPHLG